MTETKKAEERARVLAEFHSKEVIESEIQDLKVEVSEAERQKEISEQERLELIRKQKIWEYALRLKQNGGGGVNDY